MLHLLPFLFIALLISLIFPLFLFQVQKLLFALNLRLQDSFLAIIERKEEENKLLINASSQFTARNKGKKIIGQRANWGRHSDKRPSCLNWFVCFSVFLMRF
jgi:hypothetical protein